MEFTILNFLKLCKDHTRVTIHKVDRDLTRVEIASYFSGKCASVSFHPSITEKHFQIELMRVLNEVQE